MNPRYSFQTRRTSGAGWYIAGFAGIATVAILGRMARQRSQRNTSILPIHADTTLDREIQDLARIVVSETGGRGTPDERAAIAHVAVNRARKWGASIHDVGYGRVRPPKYPRARSVWNKGTQWHQKLNTAPQHPAYPAMYQLASGVLTGRVPSPIGTAKTLFVHTDTQRRLGREIPSWIISRAQGGTAPTEPVRVGRATFAGLGGRILYVRQQGVGYVWGS